MAHKTNLMVQFYHICKWGTKLKVCFKLCTIIFLKALKGIWNLQNQQSFWKQRGPRFWKMWKPVWYYVVCCLMCYGKIQNIVDENGPWWSYQWKDKAKFWSFLWCVNFIGACYHFPIVVVYP